MAPDIRCPGDTDAHCSCRMRVWAARPPRGLQRAWRLGSSPSGLRATAEFRAWAIALHAALAGSERGEAPAGVMALTGERRSEGPAKALSGVDSLGLQPLSPKGWACRVCRA